MIKKIIFILFLALPTFLIYELFGNISRGLSCPSLSGDGKKAHFIGYYMVSAGYAVLSVIASTLAFIFFRKLFRK